MVTLRSRLAVRDASALLGITLRLLTTLAFPSTRDTNSRPLGCLVCIPRCGPGSLFATPPRFWLIGHLDHGEADDLFAALEAGLKYLGHRILAQILILHMHHGVGTWGQRAGPGRGSR